MKTLLKLIAFSIALMVVGNLNAQQQRSPEERAKRETSMVKEQVALTDSQSVKYEAIALKYANMMSEFRNIPRDSVQLRQKKRAELNEKKSTEVKTILTPEQYAKYEKWMEQFRGRMGGGNRGGRGQQ
ncbi:MAG TPA: hypothetical protein VIH57_13605 [Bacteroidales bacterium]